MATALQYRLNISLIWSVMYQSKVCTCTSYMYIITRIHVTEESAPSSRYTECSIQTNRCSWGSQTWYWGCVSLSGWRTTNTRPVFGSMLKYWSVSLVLDSRYVTPSRGCWSGVVTSICVTVELFTEPWNDKEVKTLAVCAKNHKVLSHGIVRNCLDTTRAGH